MIWVKGLDIPQAAAHQAAMPPKHLIPPGPSAVLRKGSVTDNWRGMRWMLLSVVGSSAMTLAARAASWELDSRLVVLYRGGLTTLAILLLVLVMPGFRDKLRITRWRDHLLRGVLIALSTHLGFYTIATVPLATTTVLFFTAPIFATVLAVILQGESVGPRRIAAIAAGFVGVLVIMRPGFDAVELGLLTALGSSLMFALALTMSRQLAAADGPVSTFASAAVITALLSVPIAAPVLALPAQGFTWGMLGLLVATGAIRSIADIEAYHHAEAAVLAPITYLRLVLIGGASFVLFGEAVDWPTALGAVIIVAATLYIARREAALQKAQKPQKA